MSLLRSPVVSPNVAPILLAAALVSVSVLPAEGQERDPIPLSQYQSVTQSVGWVDVTVEYRRPVARGRDLFGALVPFEKVWTPAADSAAVVTFTDDVWMEGTEVPEGSYSLWLIPRAAPEAWTVILSRAARVFHAPYPEGQDLLRLEVSTTTAPHVENLQISFPWVLGPEASLHMQWGQVVLPLRIRIVAPEG
jgi:hypothetical protein